MNTQEQYEQEFFELLKQYPLPSGMKLEQVIVPKNGRNAAGIALVGRADGVAPVIYPEYYFQQYQEGQRLDKIVQEASGELLRQAEILPFDKKMIFQQITPEHLRTAMVSYEPNKQWLKDIPHERLEDLAIYGKIVLGEAHIKVNADVLSMLRMTKEEMLKTAKGNTSKEFMMEPMRDAMIRILMERDEIDAELAQALGEETEMLDLIILTTKSQIDGASVIANTEVMKQVYQELGEEFYILPSSIHEVLLVRKSEFPDSADSLKEMVQGVNQSMVAPEERLSDEIYEFDGRSIRLAGSGGLERNPDHIEPLTRRHGRSL